MACGEADLRDYRDPVATLRSELETLQKRVKELEVENAKLLSKVSSCQCQQREAKCDGAFSDAGGLVRRSKKVETGGGKSILNDFILKRYVALKVMYFGKRFYGFASEAQAEPTIESEIFKALEKTRLLVGNRKESWYSRCGRTDKGVSSTGQVIALFLRSKLKAPSENIRACLDGQIEGEIDYVRVLNRVLPDDIRVTGWCPVPPDFHARFSCLAREYKYFFWRQNLDLVAMGIACRKFIGEHDFRNFCKMDAANVHNYKRCVTSCFVSACENSYKGDGNGLYALTIKGSAFLWHQVRCMVAVMFMIGQGVESADVIDALLDTERTPRKPQYNMAPEVPLVLQSCEFENLNFIRSSDAGEALLAHLKSELLGYKLESAIFNEALQSCLPSDNGTGQSPPNGVGRKKKGAAHVPLLSRPTEPSYDERCAKLNAKRQQACSE